MPPLHHQVVTGRVATRRADHPKAAQSALEEVLRQLERQFEPTPAGLGITVAGGAPTSIATSRSSPRSHLPVDLRAAGEAEARAVLLDAIRFPSDPQETILEQNDVAILLRSDVLKNIEDGAKLIFDKLGAFEPTSIRKGFAGGGFAGGQSLRRRWPSRPAFPAPT